MQDQTTVVVPGQLEDSKAASISKPLQLLSAFVLGTVIMYGVGFLNTAAIHNAAHDTRHSQGFPCH